MAFFPTNITFTNDGTETLVEATGLPNGISEMVLPPDDYQPERKSVGNLDAIWLRPLNGAEDFGYILHSNVTSPVTADTDELWEVLRGFFSGGIARMTLAELQALVAAESLGPLAGQHVLITDLFDEGGIFLVTSATTISVDGQGLFLDCDFNNVGDYSDVEPLTGIAVVGLTRQWRPAIEAFTIVYSNLAGGSFAAGDTVTDGLLWQGVVVSDTGAQMEVYSIAGDQPDDTATLDNGAGVTADIDLVGARSILGTISIWHDAATHIYQHYQCVDDTLLDGTINPAAYMVLPRGAEDFGYVQNACPIEYDFKNEWLQRRHCQTIDIFASHALYGALGYDLIGSFPWGDPTHVSIRSLDGFWNTYNSIPTSVGAIIMHPLGRFQCILREGCTAYGMEIGSNASVISEVGAGATLSLIEVKQDVSWQHDVAPQAVVSRMVVTQGTFSATPITVANNDMQGWRVQETSITDAQLVGGIGAGIVIAPDTATRFNRCTVFLYLEAPFAAYAGPDLLVTVGGITVAMPLAGFMTNLGSNKIEVQCDFNVLGVPESTNMVLTTVGGADYVGSPFTTFNFLNVTVSWT
jgi:hypothetical protein